MKMLIETRRFGVKEVLFDDEDYELIKDYVWHVTWDRNNFYARCNIYVNGKRKSPKMHRVIMGVWKRERPHVDHINHNGLDNRKVNLRLATIGQNTKNLKFSKRNTSGYKGVYLYKKGANAGLYTACIKSGGKKYFGGYFKTAIEAAKKYNELALKHHKEFASINIFEENRAHPDKIIIQDETCIHLIRRKPKSKTGFYGVTTSSNRKKRFTATVIVNGVPKCVGYFETAEEAAKAYDEKAKEWKGEKANLNFKN